MPRYKLELAKLMKMEMKLHLISAAQLDIKLVDSPLIHEWAQSFCELPLDETEVSRFANRKDKFNQAKFNDLYNKLHNGIARYDTDAVSWTEEVKAGTDHPAIQKQLNDLHHWCVEEVKLEHKHWGAPGHDERIQEFGHLNSLCHQCETLLIEGNRQMPARCTNRYWDQQIVEQFKYALPTCAGGIFILHFVSDVESPNKNVWIINGGKGKLYIQCASSFFPK